MIVRKNKLYFKLLNETKYVYLNGDIRFPAIVVPLKYTKKESLKLAKKFYLKYQKNKDIDKNDYFNRFPSNNKIIKHFITSYELFYDCKKYKYYKCWIINLTDDKRRFIHKKNRSRKAEHKRNLKEYQDMNKFLDNYLDKKRGNLK